MNYEIVIHLERSAGAPTVGISSENPNITIVRDASTSDRDLLSAYADVLEDYLPEYFDKVAAANA